MQHICLTEKGKATDVCHYDEECEVSEREKERDAWANQSAPIAVALGLIAYAHNDNGK